MSAESVERFSFRDFYRELEVPILIAFSILVFLLVGILRFFHHIDLVSIGALGAIIVGWVYVYLSRKQIGFSFDLGPEYRVRIEAARTLGVVSVLALSSFFMITAAADDVVVSGSQHKTTLTQPVLFFIPILNDLRSVPIK